MKFLRETYKPGPDTLAYGAVDVAATDVVVRVYAPGRRRHPDEHQLEMLEPGVFALDFEFEELGNYIFVVEEDGVTQTVLNAKVYA